MTSSVRSRPSWVIQRPEAIRVIRPAGVEGSSRRAVVLLVVGTVLPGPGLRLEDGGDLVVLQPVLLDRGQGGVAGGNVFGVGPLGDEVGRPAHLAPVKWVLGKRQV